MEITLDKMLIRDLIYRSVHQIPLWTEDGAFSSFRGDMVSVYARENNVLYKERESLFISGKYSNDRTS